MMKSVHWKNNWEPLLYSGEVLNFRHLPSLFLKIEAMPKFVWVTSTELKLKALNLCHRSKGEPA